MSVPPEESADRRDPPEIQARGGEEVGGRGGGGERQQGGEGRGPGPEEGGTRSIGFIIRTLLQDILRRTAQLEQMQEVLPRKSGRYLRGIIGNVDCSILDKNEKYQYKESYEQFKLIVNLIGMNVVVSDR